MKVVLPSVKIEKMNEPVAILKNIENAGRICYQSSHKITSESCYKFVGDIIFRKHEAVLEHESITWRAVVDRGILGEVTRHRIAAFCAESSRYVKYDDIEVIKPIQLQENTTEYAVWHDTCKRAGLAYKHLIEHGVTSQNARSVLPMCLKTELVCTMNLRELRHFFELRCASGAHPDMIWLAKELLKQVAIVPVVFDDLYQRFIVT